ncbi:hypothetical protein ACQUSR_12925 [Streptomyces sp. P1-3]|uniref:hypothetical protein n=1 Tax=Streptomyces sp. P1-3 TaxID=3421658 RepID=UPI003D35A2B5
MKKLVVRSVGSLSVAAALVAGALTFAAPAQADTYKCQEVLKSRGYRVGQKATQACKAAEANDLGLGQMTCITQLKWLGVKEDHARFACSYGAK